MKDSQRRSARPARGAKYIKADNERFSTCGVSCAPGLLSISRLIMKDSQRIRARIVTRCKYIKADNERFSTRRRAKGHWR